MSARRSRRRKQARVTRITSSLPCSFSPPIVDESVRVDGDSLEEVVTQTQIEQGAKEEEEEEGIKEE
jgi:hypothetical protein